MSNEKETGRDCFQISVLFFDASQSASKCLTRLLQLAWDQWWCDHGRNQESFPKDVPRVSSRQESRQVIHSKYFRWFLDNQTRQNVRNYIEKSLTNSIIVFVLQVMKKQLKSLHRSTELTRCWMTRQNEKFTILKAKKKSKDMKGMSIFYAPKFI